jgi:hypothetical protein
VASYNFAVLCCGRRRGNINGVLVCTKCDYDNAKATVIPNEKDAKDVPAGMRQWNIKGGH